MALSLLMLPQQTMGSTHPHVQTLDVVERIDLEAGQIGRMEGLVGGAGSVSVVVMKIHIL